MGPGGRNLVKPCILNFGDFYIFNISDIYLCVGWFESRGFAKK